MHKFAEISRFSRKEIDQLWNTARRVVKHPSIHILRGPAAKNTGHLLIVTSRKVGSAPERNQLRRRLKSIFHEEKLYDRGYDFIAIARPGIADLPFQELKTLMLHAATPPKEKM
jgi:ribonuclease P protein component